MRKPEPGTIVRVTGLNHERRFKDEAWGVVVPGPTNSRACVYILYTIGDALKEFEYNPTNGSANGWWLHYTEYVVVSDDQVPDYVWSALGQAGLTGELVC